MVAEVSAHEDEGIGVCGCSCQGTEVADGVSWCIEEIKRAVPEEVVSAEAADLDTVLLEVDFS